MNCFFYGCWDDQKGHYLYGPSGTYRDAKLPMNWPFRQSERKASAIDGLFVSSMDEQSECVLVFITSYTQWTILSCADYSADTRPGSNASLIVDGYYTFDEMVEHFKKSFPIQFERINSKKPLVLRNLR